MFQWCKLSSLEFGTSLCTFFVDQGWCCCISECTDHMSLLDFRFLRNRASLQCHFPYLALFLVHFGVLFRALFWSRIFGILRSGDILTFQKFIYGPFPAFFFRPWIDAQNRRPSYMLSCVFPHHSRVCVLTQLMALDLSLRTVFVGRISSIKCRDEI